MSFRSLFQNRRVCGIDTSGGSRVCVMAHKDASGVVFQSVQDLSGDFDAACAVPARFSLVRRLESPFKSLSKTRRVLPSLMDVQMPFSVEECSVAFSNLEKNDDGRIEAIATAARTTDIDRVLADLHKVGVDPVFLYSEGLALWEESLCESGVTNAAGVAVLKIGPSGATLCLGKGERLHSTHALSSLDPGHVKRILFSVFGRAEPLTWRLAGELAQDGATREFLRQFRGDWVESIEEHDNPSEFLARALARAALSEKSMRVNLRSGELAHPAFRKLVSDRIAGLAMVLAVSGLVMCLLAAAAGVIVRSRVSALEAQFIERASALAGGNLNGAEGIHALQLAERAVDEQLAAASPVLAPFKESSFSLLRSIAGECRDAGILIEVLSIVPGRIRIEGSAPSWNVPRKLEIFLKRKGFKVDLEREESLADESVGFVATAEGVL